MAQWLKSVRFLTTWLVCGGLERCLRLETLASMQRLRLAVFATVCSASAAAVGCSAIGVGTQNTHTRRTIQRRTGGRHESWWRKYTRSVDRHRVRRRFDDWNVVRTSSNERTVKKNYYNKWKKKVKTLWLNLCAWVEEKLMIRKKTTITQPSVRLERQLSVAMRLWKDGVPQPWLSELPFLYRWYQRQLHNFMLLAGSRLLYTNIDNSARIFVALYCYLFMLPTKKVYVKVKV